MQFDKTSSCLSFLKLEKKLTIEQLAKKAGMSKGQMGNILSGRAGLPPWAAKKLSKALKDPELLEIISYRMAIDFRATYLKRSKLK